MTTAMPQNTITVELTTIINQALSSLNLPQQSTVHLEHPADQSHGDYATNVAMTLFGSSKTSGAELNYPTPRALAEAIANAINYQLQNQLPADASSTTPSPIDTVAVAGPGFINFHLSEAFLVAKMGEIAHFAGNGPAETDLGRKVVVEYSSPNIAKPFTVGHLRSTIIGDAIANLLQKTGATVYRDNHLGDWGTQFGKQIYAIKTWGDEAAIGQAENPVKELVALYVKFHEEAEKDPTLEDEGRAWFKKLEDGDPEARRLWQQCIEWSWREFAKIYERLNIHFTENDGRGYGESFFEDKMQPVIDELAAKGLLEESQGAKLVFFPGDSLPPLMIVKKDGSTLYSTRDLAADKFRLEHYGPDITIINETGAEQSLYFRQIYETEQLLGWYKPGQRVHVGHGMIRFKDKKMSTRKGNVIWLETVLQEAHDRVVAMAADGLSDEDIWKIAVGAIKWNDLKRSAHLPVVFDWDEILSLKGNAGPYLQYTYVRALSILKKAALGLGQELEKDDRGYIAKPFDTLLNLSIHYGYQPNQHEKDILRNLYTYFEVIESSTADYAPHYLANYLYNLAQLFNAFYNQHPVVGEEATGAESADGFSPATKFRLALTLAVSRVVHEGLELLGIEVVERM